MLPNYSFLKVVDNSGAKLVKIIGFYGHPGKAVGVGEVVKVAIKEAKGEKVSAGEMKKAVIVEQKFPVFRPNGSHFRHLRNSCVLLSEKGQPLGNKVRALLTYEFIKPRWSKLRTITTKKLF
uniref:uL14m n=1 Tax=Polytomella magna TaxID=353565 RepID=UPI002240E473|nr:Chain Ai, uL14m [Polytomella magna]8APN_Ai Chain Ai, Hypothetical protein [Polytomella magna]8APO_Ai Chain Ai, uL14m [Polytomella magna]